MSYMHPAAIAARRKYWTRHDAHRFAPPVPPKSFASRRIEQRKAEEEFASAAEQDAFERELLQVRRDLAALKLELALRGVFHKYSPDQPRVSRGNPDGGRWTNGVNAMGNAAAADRSGGQILSDATPDPVKPGAQYAQTRVEISQALTGQSQVDETTRKLAGRLAKAADRIPRGFGPIYGIAVHEAFKAEVRAGGVRGVESGDIEPTFGGTGRYGSKGSLRPDLVFRDDAGDIAAIYDVKTGGADMRASRANRLRDAVGVGPNVPVIQLHLDEGATLKCHRPQS